MATAACSSALARLRSSEGSSSPSLKIECVCRSMRLAWDMLAVSIGARQPVSTDQPAWSGISEESGMQYGNGTRAQWGIKDILLGSLVAGVLFAVGVFAVAIAWVALQFAGIELPQSV